MNRKKLLRNRIFTPMAILVVAVLFLSACVGILLNLRENDERRNINLQNAARMVAEMSAVYGTDQSITAQRMNNLIYKLQGIDVISIVDNNKVRLFHTNNNLIGTEYDGVIPDFSEYGTLGYVENGNGPSGLQRRAYAPIYSRDGRYEGFVLAIELMKNIRAEVTKTLLVYGVVLGIILIAAMTISSKVSNRIKNTLMGYEPDVFSSMYSIRDNILDAVDEGILGVDTKGNIQFINHAADLMVGKENNPVVKMLTEPVETGKKSTGKQINLNDHKIIMDCIPIRKNAATVGAIAVMHDRTELAKLMDELTGTKYLVDSMRANNHDFTNKLHVIMGLIQMEMYDEATKYIENITIVQRETISNIMNMIDDPTIAALLIGKLARAAELNIKLTVDEKSRYNSESFGIPSGILVTILGNLIENGFEALDAENTTDAQGNNEGKILKVCIISEKDGVYLSVEDNGPGMSEEIKKHIFDNGYSTKGANRGTGLYQVNEIVSGAGGIIWVESEPGKGSIFKIRIGGR